MTHPIALAALGVCLIVGGLMGYVRLAPDDPGRWHGAVAELPDEALATAPLFREVPGGATGFLPSPSPQAVLARLADLAATVPRTRLLAGSADQGRITWVARSRLWGFPDYITAEATPLGVRLWSRQRYGLRDLGVNLARLTTWAAQL